MGGLQAGEEGEDVVTRWEAQMGVLHTVHSYKHQAAAATVTCHLDTYTDITAAPSVCDDYIKVACCEIQGYIHKSKVHLTSYSNPWPLVTYSE